MDSPVIGIDLGTTNSVAAALIDGKPRILAAGGERLIPSVVSLAADGRLLVGTPAKHQYVVNPRHTIKSVKRLMGQDTLLTLGERTCTPAEVSSLILQKVKAVAEESMGQPVEQAVITVPAYFTDIQRQATKQAGEMAGLEVLRIINEPTAAALVYGLGRSAHQKVLVYDLGGGTFDVSIVEIQSGVVEVLATAGNNLLGGDDFDARLVDHLAQQFMKKHDTDPREDIQALARLTAAAENAKIVLSSHPFTRVSEPFLVTKSGRPLNLDVEVSRLQFVDLIEDLLQSTGVLTAKALQDAGLAGQDLDQVLLVGGSTRIPAVREMVQNCLGHFPRGEINPDECVALGAAVQAGLAAGAGVDMILVDVNPYSLGVRSQGTSFGLFHTDLMSVIIPRNTAIPVSCSEVYTTSVDNQDEVRVQIYQGESKIASKNILLGEFVMEDIPPMPAHEPEIVVRFDYDIDGMVHVSATERSTGQEKDITIRGTGEKAPADAESGRGGRARRKAAVRRAEKLLDKLNEHQRGSLEGLLKALERAEKQGNEQEADRMVEDMWELMYEDRD
ncbi:MAG TPA: Hsp70 family protein [Spirochaetia bacterium]|nr:Hsp70 family protein [Spirochaetia bacterium]